MFLAESREHLQNLNLAVIRIEESPDDRDTHRRDLPHRALPEGDERHDGLRPDGRAHAQDGGRLRDAARPVRRRSSTPSSTSCWAASTRSRARSTAIETTGDGGSRRDRARRPPRRARRASRRTRPPRPPAAEAAAAGATARRSCMATTATRRSCSIEIELAADVMMPAVRAYMVLAAIADHGEVIHSHARLRRGRHVRRPPARGVGRDGARGRDDRGRRPRRPRRRRRCSRLGRGADRGGRGPRRRQPKRRRRRGEARGARGGARRRAGAHARRRPSASTPSGSTS